MEKEQSKNHNMNRRTFFGCLGSALLGLGGIGFGQTMYDGVHINKQTMAT